jgi:hypothetical protein
MAGALWGVEDLIIEHGEVEGQAQANGVRGGEVHQGDVLQRASRARYEQHYAIQQ